jgi:hypothetical protein
MMEAARTSETSVDIHLGTRQYIPEDSELHNLYTCLKKLLKRQDANCHKFSISGTSITSELLRPKVRLPKLV